MQPNQIPQTGADFSCSNLWQIYILRGGVQWCPVGLLRDRALAEIHIASLRKMMRHNQFQLVWAGGGMNSVRCPSCLSANITVHFPGASCLEASCLWSGAEFDLLYKGDPLGATP
jgi:hypothetical protein